MLALVRKARELRQSPVSHATITSYKASAEGHIYFYLDRDDGGESVPMRVDQVAVDFYGSADGRTRQIIRGMRKQELLPVQDFRYYIDRLTAVQNGFGDRISIGEGRDVSDVPHPLGSEGAGLYHYRIADSIRVSVPTLPATIRVYEVEVRPRREDRPAFVGSVFLDAETGALARMVFTFTAASYVDPRVDRITVRLEHALWEETLWLPYRQLLEVRREIPELDLPVGSVIRATLDVTGYDFNPELEPGFFSGPAVTLVPYGAADSAQFRAGLMDRMAEEGLSPVSIARLETEARQAARAQFASGLPKMRLYADRFSSVLRVNRAEGVHMGLGASFSPRDFLKLDGLGGFGTANRKVTGTLRGRWTTADGSAMATLELYGRQLRDPGPRPGASGAVNTLSTFFRNLDYTDPYFATGTRFSMERRIGTGARIRMGGVLEDFAGATRPWSLGSGGIARQRPIRPAGEGTFASASVEFLNRWGGLSAWGAEASATGTAGRWDGSGNATVTTRLEGRAVTRDLARRVSVAVAAGGSWGTLPHQLLFFLGGRGTLPGHPFRAYGGRRFFLTSAEAAFSIVPGWLTVRLVAGAGAVGATPASARYTWEVGPTEGLRGYAGTGVATLHDILRIDGTWGLPGGAFEVMFSVDPRLRPYL